MKNSNIIAAGKMLSIALVVFGTLVCAGVFTYFRSRLGDLPPAVLGETLWSNLIAGAALLVCGIMLLVMFPQAERRPEFAVPILILGVFVACAGVTAAALMPHNPFYWIAALIGVPMFIDALCLKINLGNKNLKKHDR